MDINLRPRLASGLLAAWLLASASCHVSASESDAASLVRRLYRAYASQVVLADENRSILNGSHHELARYFSPDLLALIERDRTCAARTHEICKLDFDPIWASQDPGAYDLRVVSGDRSDTVQVSFKYPSNGDVLTLTYHLVKTAKGWRIADIEYSGDDSLRQILNAPDH